MVCARKARRVGIIELVQVGLVCPYSLSIWGGVQAQVLGLAKALRAKGVEAKVLAPVDDVPPEPWVIPIGRSIPFAENGSLAPIAPDIPAQLRMLSVFNENSFDVLHLHEPLVPGPSLTSLVVKPAPVVGTFHASGDVRAYRWIPKTVKRLAKRVDVNVAVSLEAGAMVKRSLDVDPVILNNGVSLPPASNTSELVSNMGETPHVLFLGRHEERKGLSVLLESVAKFTGPIKLSVAGVGPETERLKERYRSDTRIDWLGAISAEGKAEALAKANILCVPSTSGESFGIVLVEGMAAGTHLVVSDLPAYEMVTKGSECATLFPAGDVDALTASLEAVIKGFPDMTLLENARQRAAEFSMELLADKYLELYQSAI